MSLEHELQTAGRLTWKLNEDIKTWRNIEKVTSGKEEVLTNNGSYKVTNAKKGPSTVYTSVIHDSDGKQVFQNEIRLCVLGR